MSRYFAAPLYRVIDTQTGKPAGEPMPQKDAEVTATALNAREAHEAKKTPRMWLVTEGDGNSIVAPGGGARLHYGTARPVEITPELVERLRASFNSGIHAYTNGLNTFPCTYGDIRAGIRAVLEEFLKV